ncbi:MAG TPA: hypothetical protein VIG51_12550, partial [Candidatus Baltobacteraceae bacterium]
VAIVAAYVAGHLLAAIGNVAEPIFEALGAPRLATLANETDWVKRGYVSDGQIDALRALAARFGIRSTNNFWPVDQPESTS